MRRRSICAPLLLVAVFSVFLIYPILRLLGEISPATLASVVQGGLANVVRNSLLSACLATLVTVTLAYGAAYATVRLSVPFSRVFGFLFLFPMFVPSVSGAMGLVVLFGNNGLLTRLFGLSQGVYGLGGILMGSFLYAFPVAYLMLSDVMRYEDASPHEAAAVLGVGRWHRFTGVGLPHLWRPLLSTVFAVFALVVTDYGVPLVLGGRYETVSVVLYREVVGRQAFDQGAVLGVILLIPAALAFVFDLFDRKKGRLSTVARPFVRTGSRTSRWIATAFCVALSLYILLPVAAFLVRGFATNYPFDLTPTWEHMARTFRLGAAKYLLNAVAVALTVAVCGTFFAFFAAYLTARRGGIAAKLLHLLSMTTAAVPGLVLGLSYVIAFRGSAFVRGFAVLCVVGGVHFLASPYLMCHHALAKLSGSLEDTADTLGIGRVRLLFGVILPQCRATLVEMASYFFVNCMMTISAVSFLATARTRPLSLMISQFEAQGRPECAAIVSLFILCVNLAFRGFMRLVQKKT